MELVISFIKGYFIFTLLIMVLYSFRHLLLTCSRFFTRQRMDYTDIYDSELPSLSVLIPMYNEELVLHHILTSLIACDYDLSRLQIIPINDNSTDKTKDILDQYSAKYPFIQPLHRCSELRGKPAGLNDALEIATGDLILVFDADYRPGKNLLKNLAISFADPEVGAVMGRVIPYNATKNLLTRLLNIERSGGYQVDQQARYNLRLIPQYGGTVGGFRKDIIVNSGGFKVEILAEDTELTFRLYTMGYKVIYANNCECYEEAPETWEVRARQIRRWSRGHNQVMFRYTLPVITSKYMSFREKIDGLFVLGVYMMPVILFLGILSSVFLFFVGEITLFIGLWPFIIVTGFSAYGNFAPFYEIGTGLALDGMKKEIGLLPLMTFSFYFYMWHISLGFKDAIIDRLTFRNVKWDKTVRFTDTQQEVKNL